MDRLLASLVAGRPTGSLQIRTTADSLAGIEPANRVLSVGTWVLAATVLLVGGFTLAQAVRRHLGSHATQERVLQVVGFTRSDGVAAATLPGVVAGLVAATLTAPVALAVSPVFPLGRARLLEPDPGPHLDVPVVAAGVAITLVATVGAFAVLSWLDLRERPRERRVERPRLLAAMTPVAPPPVLLGLHLVSEPARGRRGLSARTAMAAAALGVAGLVAATTFSQSLDRLVTTPSLYGLDLDLTIEVPESQLARRLDEVAATPGVEAVAEERSADVRLGGVETVGIAWTSRRGSIEPAVLEGRLPSGPDEVAAGPALLRRLGRDIGDRVTLGDGDAARPVTVVGTVLSPQVVAEDHSSRVVLRADTLDEVAGDQPYPMIVVRYAPGADDAAITAELDRRYPFGVMDESYPTPPPPLRNLADVDAVPTVLVWFFGSLSLVALTNGVVVSGRRARHSLGVARGLGFTSGQVRTVALAMALAIAAVAVVVGVPLGLVVGATAWSGVIDRMDLLPVVRWPVAVAVLVVPVAAAVAALASRWPARAANAHHPADILRVE
jgi:putative ABC transport system permease protein